ncbi:MAG: glycosyltransferase [Candidatus Dojkabacteria bacterium]
MKKKVLILIGDVANGHRSAANALTHSFETLFPDHVEVETVDVFTVDKSTQPFYSADSTHLLISQNRTVELVANTLFKFFNTEDGYNLFRWFAHQKLSKVILDILEENKPDVVISIHPIVSAALNKVKTHNEAEFKSVTVITDLVTLFRGWADTSSDLVFAPTKESVNNLINFGVDVKNIKFPLFPINPNMEKAEERNSIFKSLGLDPTKKTVLLTGGGFGIESLKKAISNISKKFQDLQIILIAGKNINFKSYLEDKYKNNKNIKILGYVNNMQDFIFVSDIVIGKPGPATILEFEVFNKKAILTKKIGEQEIGNIAYAKSNPNFRYIGEDWSKLEETIMDLLDKKIIGNPKRSADECDLIVKEIFKIL